MNRIEAIASFAEGSKVICDIGCDHAYTSITAIKHYGVEKAIACDIAEGPLENARKTVLTHYLAKEIQIRLSDGFSRVEAEEFDTAIVSGMGGILICDILSKALSKLENKRLIIEANSDSNQVRSLLCANGFQITRELALYDHNKYYEIILFEPGMKDYTSLDLEYGPYLRREKSTAFIKHYERKKQILSDVVSKLSSPKERKQLEKQIAEYSQILEE